MSERIRVLHVITGLATGGAETALHNLLKGGLADIFDSKVISLRNEGTMGTKLIELGVPLAVLGISGAMPSLTSLRKLRREVNVFRPDLIQGWMYHGNLAAVVATALTPDVPALAWNIRHSLYDLTAEKLTTRQVIHANRFLSGRPNIILYNSELSRVQHEAFGVKGCGGKVIPNGFDLEVLGYSDSVARTIRKTLGIPPNCRVVGHVARYHPMKNHVGFLRAAVRVGAISKDIHFVLAGSGVLAGNDTLAELVPDVMRDQFHWLGDRQDIPDLMCAMDILCQSSSWGEGFPNVLGEAMATRVPCVATDVGDSAAIIGNTGLVVPPQDEDALAEALEKMLDMTSSQRKALGTAARTRVIEEYSLKAVVQEYATAYRCLVKNGKGSS